MPDRSRYPWLPRQNVVDPSIFTQLDPKRKLPTPDGAPLPDNDLQAQDKNKITIKPGAGPAPGGGIGPPVTPGPGPSIPTLPAPPGSGQTHNPPPPQTPPFPTVSIGPMGTPPGASGPVGPPVNPMPAGIPPQATPSDPNLNTSTVTYPGLGPTPAPPTNPNPVELPPFPTVSTGPRPGGTGTTGTPPSIPLPQMPTMSTGPTGGGGGEPAGGGEPPPEPSYPFPPPIPPVATPSPEPDQLTDVSSSITYGGEPAEPPGEEEDADRDYEAMAKGGIIRRPTRVKLGEAGPEAVVPVGPRMNYRWRAR